MVALTSVRGQEAKTFQTLTKYLKDDANRLPAIRALQRIPKQYWPKEDAKPTVEVVLAHIRKIPTKDRTGSDALDALEFADRLASRQTLVEHGFEFSPAPDFLNQARFKF